MVQAGLPYNLTLLQALNLGGGGCFDLARQGVAALLNSCGLSGNYYYNSAQVISIMHNAYMTHNCNPITPSFDQTNEEPDDMCPAGGRATKNATSRFGIIANQDVTIHAFPNPFSDRATIEVMPNMDFNQVTVEVFDLNGRQVAMLYNGSMKADQFYTFSLNGNTLAEGVYIYRVTTDEMYYNGKIVLINK